MSNISIVLVYEPQSANGRPIPVARSKDPELVLAVARQAMGEADSKAVTLSESDELLGEVENAEAERLRSILLTLIPELQG